MNAPALYDILTKYAASQGLRLNDDTPFVMDIIEGLLVNETRYGYRSCPCRLAAGERPKDADILCPCAYRDADIKQYGSCYCGLYVTPAWIDGTIARRQVPERRPVEKRLL